MNMQDLSNLSSSALAEHYRTDERYRQSCRASAFAWGRANPSDPHSAATALAHMRSGISLASGYSVTFQREHRELELPDGRTLEWSTMFPKDMKRGA